MIKPQPKTYKCISCNWSKIVSPQRDALTPLDYFEECPKCGEKKLDVVPAISVDVFLDKVKGLFK